MKSILVALFLNFVIASIDADNQDDCAKELGYKSFISQKKISGDKRLCCYTCVQVKNGYLKPDYTIDVEGQLENMKKMAEESKGEMSFEQMKEVANACRNVAKGKSLCEATPLLHECYITEERKRGITFQK